MQRNTTIAQERDALAQRLAEERLRADELSLKLARKMLRNQWTMSIKERDGERYVSVMLYRKSQLHAIISGMTLTEAKAFGSEFGILLWRENRHIHRLRCPSAGVSGGRESGS